MRLANLFSLGFLLPALASCSGDLGAALCSTDFGGSADAKKVTAFVTAAADFTNAAVRLDDQLRTTCLAMAMDLGLQTSDVTVDQAGTQRICQRVAQEIQATVQAVRAANVQIRVEAVPPECRASVQAYANCAAACDVTYVPAMSTLRCDGGEIRGSCSATCNGRCAVDVNATCSGACEGTCSASCTGTCSGICEGTCSVRAADGSCNGACTGTCRGTCSAGCTGTCQGKCVANVSGSCTAQCRGECSVQWREPVCTGTVRPPEVNADCRAACEARISASLDCTPGSAQVRVSDPAALADLTARVTRMTTSVANNWGRFLAVKTQIERLLQSGQLLVQSGQQLPMALQNLAAQAASASACIAARTATLVSTAVPRVQVSVQVTVSLSASVQAQ